MARALIAYLAVGLAAAGVAAAVTLLALGVAGAEAVHEAVVLRSPLLALALTPAGCALLVFVTRTLFPGAQGGGVPQTLALYHGAGAGAGAASQPLLSLRIAFGKIVLTVAGFACGASIGREGPGIQIGASIVHATRNLGALPARALIVAGAAAGVTATFGAPLAAIAFAFEQFERRFDPRTAVAVLVAVVVATLACEQFRGDAPYFGHSADLANRARDWVAAVACGIAAGGLGAVFNRGLVGTQRRLRPLLQARPYACAAVLGLLVGAINLATSVAMHGSGFAATQPLLHGGGAIAVFEPFAKLAATLLSSLAAIPGGLFSPSLAVGASFGATLAPLLGGGALCAVFAMAAYLAGVTQAPLAAALMVMEMLDAPQLLPPLLLAALVAFAASRLLVRESVYEGMRRNL